MDKMKEAASSEETLSDFLAGKIITFDYTGRYGKQSIKRVQVTRMEMITIPEYSESKLTLGGIDLNLSEKRNFITTGIRNVKIEQNILADIPTAVLCKNLANFKFSSLSREKLEEVYRCLAAKTTKVCPKCLNTHLLEFRTLDRKVCVDCGTELKWNLSTGQKRLL
jgi:hypothetical protein